MVVITFAPLPFPDDNGAALTQLFLNSGPNTTIFLLPSALYHLQTTIDFCHSSNTLATATYPSVSSNLQAILETRGQNESKAINMFNKSHCALRNVHIRGCRGWGRSKPKAGDKELALKGAMGVLEGGGAMVWMGGPGTSDSVVEECRLEDPRGWTALHVVDFALRMSILNNVVGPCGQEAPAGPWADGLSIAGRESIVTGNTIFDATDGAIVIFCAPGSLISNNTIIARARDALGGINLVDDGPFKQDYSGTRVIGNEIRTEGAYIHLAMGCGLSCWSHWNEYHKLNYGASILDNQIGPGEMGYGIALSSVKEFTVWGNHVSPGTQFIGNTCKFGIPVNAPPTAFLTEWNDKGRTIDCVLQNDFVEGNVSWLIGIERGLGNYLSYEGGQLSGSEENFAVRLSGMTWGLAKGALELVREVGGELIWSSRKVGEAVPRSGERTTLDFSREGRLSVKSGTRTIWDPTGYLSPLSLSSLAISETSTFHEPTVPELHPSVFLSNLPPYLTLFDPNLNTLFATSYLYKSGEWNMAGGNWISIAPESLRGSSVSDHSEDEAPPPMPPSFIPVYLLVDSNTSQLVLHQSSMPTSPHTDSIIFALPPTAANYDSTWLSFQPDGNLVLYGKRGENVSVRWASGTNGGAHGGAKIVELIVGGEGGSTPARVEFRDQTGALCFQLP